MAVAIGGFGMSDGLLGSLGHQLCPEWEHFAAGFQHAQGTRVEPHVEVGRTVTPAIDVHPRDVTEAQDRPLERATTGP